MRRFLCVLLLLLTINSFSLFAGIKNGSGFVIGGIDTTLNYLTSGEDNSTNKINCF